MRGRGERSTLEQRVAQLEGELVVAKIMARRCWLALKARTGLAEDVLLNPQVRRLLDPAFDAAEAVWERHQILVEPCRQLLDPVDAVDPGGFGEAAWPRQHEMYVGHWPDGRVQNLTRDQLLMMGGQDPGQ